MKSKLLLIIPLICIFLVAVFFMSGLFTEAITTEPPQKASTENHSVTPDKKIVTAAKGSEPQKVILKRQSTVTHSAEPNVEIDTEPEEEIETVETLKEKITDIAVEYIEDISLLDDLVQESASEPEELWEGEWVSIDDWKRRKDSFSVEKNEDGEFELIPEKDNIQSFSYNEETKEFQWELDYYGKKIIHKARFISEDVMVLMKISGIKVALDIYKRNAG